MHVQRLIMFILAFINLCSTLYVHSWFTFCMTSFLLLENTIHTIYKYLPNNAKKCINCSHYIFLQFKTLKSTHRSRVYLHNTLKSFKKTTGNSVVHHEKACEPSADIVGIPEIACLSIPQILEKHPAATAKAFVSISALSRALIHHGSFSH